MLNKEISIGRPFRGGWLIVLMLMSLASPLLPAMDIQIPTLKSGTDVYTNVTVYQMSATDIFMRHGRGFGNAKISSLDDDTLILLGLKKEKAEASKASSVTVDAQSAEAVEKVKTALATVNVDLPSEDLLKERLAQIKTSPQILYGILGGLVIGYLLFCWCLQKVCVNAGSRPGLLVWLPILQMFPLLRAAKMPAWWFVVFCIPVITIPAHLRWCARIVQVCGKGFWTGLMLFLPGTNILALLYLAFSGGGGRATGKPLRNAELPGLVGA